MVEPRRSVHDLKEFSEDEEEEEEANQLIDDVTADRLRVSSIFKGE